LKTTRILKHGLYWLGAFAFYGIYFGFRGDVYGQSSLFVGLLLPITAITSYAIMYWLIPRYLLARRYVSFGLYLSYTLLFSLYLELSLMMVLYLTNGDFQSIFTRPTIIDLMDLVTGMYLVVFGAVSLNLWGRWSRAHLKAEEGQNKLQKAEHQLWRIQSQKPHILSLRSDRKEIKIPSNEISYVESVKDYVLVHAGKDETMSKRTLSSVEAELSNVGFIRIHRSYLVRVEAVESFSPTELQIGSITLPISRTYREVAMQNLRSS